MLQSNHNRNTNAEGRLWLPNYIWCRIGTFLEGTPIVHLPDPRDWFRLSRDPSALREFPRNLRSNPALIEWVVSYNCNLEDYSCWEQFYPNSCPEGSALTLKHLSPVKELSDEVVLYFLRDDMDNMEFVPNDYPDERQDRLRRLPEVKELAQEQDSEWRFICACYSYQECWQCGDMNVPDGYRCRDPTCRAYLCSCSE